MKKFFTLIAAVAMAASVHAQDVVKTFTETTVLLTNEANVNAAIAEGWAAGGVTKGSKKGSINPETGEEGDPGSYNAEGVILKKDNKAKWLTVNVTGVSEIIAYGVTASSSDARYLDLGAVASDGSDAIFASEKTEVQKSAAVSVELDKDKAYKISFNGVGADDKGADVALHGIKFVVAGDPTGITNVATAASAKSGKTYNITGQEVSSSYKGLVIKNGKKYVK